RPQICFRVDPSRGIGARDFRQQISRSTTSRSRPQDGSNKTGAYSPPRFSAPVLKVSRETGEPGRSSTFGQLVRRAGAGAKKPEYKGLNPRCPAAARRVNDKEGAVFT